MMVSRHFIARTTSGEFVDAAGATMQILTRYGVRETAGATASVRFMAGGSSAPATPTGAQSSAAGSVTIGNKTAKVVYNMPNGSTTPSSASASFSNDGSHKATITFAAPPIGATGTSVYLNTSGRNEVQTITPTAGAAADTFTLAYAATDSSVITIPSGGYAFITLAQIQAALTSIPALAGNYTATGATGGPFTVTFNNGLADTNVSALSLTNAVGASAATFATVTGGVAQGTTWYKGEAGTSPSVAPGLTTYEFSATDAALVGYDAAPTTNTSGEEVDVIALAANERVNVALSTPENGLRMRVEVLSGAVVARVAGQ